MQGLPSEGLGRGQGHPAAHQVSPLPAPLLTPVPLSSGAGGALAGQEVEGGILPKPLTHCVTWVASPASVSLP